VKTQSTVLAETLDGHRGEAASTISVEGEQHDAEGLTRDEEAMRARATCGDDSI
jgi:hypothetical protein